jgi:hypothetical protein
MGSATSMRMPDAEKSRTFPGAERGSPEAPFHFNLTSASDSVRSDPREFCLFTIVPFVRGEGAFPSERGREQHCRAEARVDSAAKW